MSRTLTGRDVHEAYNKVQLDDVKKRGMKYTPTTVNDWKDISEKARKLYDRMADHLNKVLTEREATSC